MWKRVGFRAVLHERDTRCRDAGDPRLESGLTPAYNCNCDNTLQQG
jgi:hypothetical protein